MKTKYKRFGNSAIALVLSAIMLLSSSIVGSSSTIDTKAIEADSVAVEETTPTETVTEEALTEETVSAGHTVFVDNKEVEKTDSVEGEEPAAVEEETETAAAVENKEDVKTDSAEVSAVKLGSSVKTTPEKSGATQTWYLRGQNFSVGSTQGSWDANKGILLTQAGSSDYYYADITFTSSAEFKICSSDATWTGISQYGHDKVNNALYVLNTTLIDNGGSIDTLKLSSTTSNISVTTAGTVRLVFNSSNGEVSFVRPETDVRIVGGGIKKLNGTEIGWNASNSISWDNTDDITNCYVDVTLDQTYSDTKAVKLYFPSSNTWYGCRTSSKNNLGNSAVASFWQGKTNGDDDAKFGSLSGNYRLYYNSITYSVWPEELAATHDITLGTVANGTISCDDVDDVATGTEVTINTSPSSGYYTSALTVTKSGGGTVTANRGSSLNEYKFYMPDDDVTVSATFVQTTDLTITPTVPQVGGADPGTVSPASATVTVGETATFTAIENSGYGFTSWTIGGTEGTDYILVSGTDSLELEYYPLTANATVQANFVVDNNVRIYFYRCDQWADVPYVRYTTDTGTNKWDTSGAVAPFAMTLVDSSRNLYTAKVPAESTIYFQNGSEPGSASINYSVNNLTAKANYAYASNDWYSDNRNSINVQCSSGLYEITLDDSKTYIVYSTDPQTEPVNNYSTTAVETTLKSVSESVVDES